MSHPMPPEMSPETSLLGKTTDYPRAYAPELLFGIPRAEGRRAVGLDEGALPFQGEDLWTHYELSWLDASGKPCVGVGEIRVPATSLRLIESKSMKLYFNSLNFMRFADEVALVECVVADLSAVAGATVGFRLLAAADLAVRDFPGQSLDGLALPEASFVLSTASLRADGGRRVLETLHTHLLRSNCPVTNQPDWGSVLVRYEGPAIDHAGLLAYLVSYRNHADFHEQCVERIFADLLRHCRPERLTVYARYTRRGGLDINPFRTNCGDAVPVCRIARQ